MLLQIVITNKLYTQIIINGSIRNKEGITLSNVNVLINKQKNKKNTPERIELKKFNPLMKKYTIHKEIK